MNDAVKVTIVGGGSSAHLLIPLLDTSGLKVSILTSRPSEWDDTIYVDYCNENNEVLERFSGRLDKVSGNPKDVIPQADVVILCMPVYQYRSALKRIAPHVSSDRETFVGTVYGQGGFDWMLREAFSGYKCKHVVGFAVGLLPWICRVKEYGSVGITYGPKHKNVVALTDKNKFDWLNDKVLRKMSEEHFGSGEFLLSDNFISLTLSVDNQIIHPSRCYALSGLSEVWADLEDVPFFYRDFDDESAAVLRGVDLEYTQIRKSIRERFNGLDYSDMLDYLSLERLSYGSSNTDIKKSFVESSTLGAIKPPLIKRGGGYYIDSEHRFFLDDINYGLCIAKWFAEKLGVSTPCIDSIVEWVEIVRGVSFSSGEDENAGRMIRDDLGTPSCYGIESVEEALGLI